MSHPAHMPRIGLLAQAPLCRMVGQMEENPHQTRETDDASALFMLTPEGLGGVGSAFGRTRLRTFIALRWMAVIGQTFAVLMVAFGLGFDISLGLALAAIAASAWLNVFLAFAYPAQRLLSGREAMMQLGFDTVQLAALLAITGGLANPFLLLLVAPVTVAAISLKPIYAAGLGALALFLALMMSYFALPLPAPPGSAITVPQLFQWGHLGALAVGLSFFALSAWRVSQDEARLVRALDAAQIVMAREQQLSALGAMSAMTAHELGTPLATIHLVAKEMAAEFEPGSPHHEDAALLVSQAERCKAIIGQLSREKEAGDIIHAQMPIRAVAEEAAAPHKGLGVQIIVKAEPGKDGEAKLPIVRRSPEVLHALGAFIENAVSFATSEVTIVTRWTPEHFVFSICDDGPGFAAEILPKLGEPYISERGEAQSGGGDMGLGFFIAKTLIERTGGQVATRNHPSPASGAVVQAIWPRLALEADTKTTI